MKCKEKKPVVTVEGSIQNFRETNVQRLVQHVVDVRNETTGRRCADKNWQMDQQKTRSVPKVARSIPVEKTTNDEMYMISDRKILMRTIYLRN